MTMEDTITIEDEVIAEEVEVIVEEVIVMVDPKDEKIMELESEIEFIKEKHIKGIEDIKQAHKFECIRFGDFIENLNLLFIDLLLMIQLYILWEGEGGYHENLK